jgi:hypothetical protein
MDRSPGWVSSVTAQPTTAIPQTHTEWQQTVVDLLHTLGWQHLHVRKSVGRGRRWTTTTNIVGWVDLFAWHPAKGGVVAIEIKVRPDSPTVDQLAVHASLRAAGIPTYVWYPEHFDYAVLVLRDLLMGEQRPND